MSEIVHKLADLTAVRDRDALDSILISTIHDLLQPRMTAIYRAVGEEPQARWLSCSSISATQLTPTLGGAWAELDSLPLLSEFPQRQLAVASRQVQQPDDSPSLAIFPLTSNAGSSAVLEINTDAPLAKESLQLVNGVLRLYLNFQSLLDYGERDALTDLLNRKTFDGAFMKATLAQQQLIEPDPDGRRNTANVASYWLAMIDIDHFKRVNDNYGHLIGDEVLLLLARLMRSSFRFHDQLYRFGGEEFVVLMRCHGEAEARIALERLRAETENHLFPQVGMITISTGFSEVKTGDTPSAAFERADKAVYYAKAHGRNQVCSYAALVASGDLTDKSEDSGELELF